MLKNILPTKEELSSKTFIVGVVLSSLLTGLINYPLFNNYLLFDLSKELFTMFKYDEKAFYLFAVIAEKMLVSIFTTLMFFIPFFLRNSKSKIDKLFSFYIPFILVNFLICYSLLIHFSIGFDNLENLLIINRIIQ